jgi:hypothetical protein
MSTREDFDSDPMAAFLVRYSPVGPMPVDAAMALSTANQARPGILSPRADKDEVEEF